MGSIRKKISMVIRLLDDYTGEEISTGEITLEEKRIDAINKKDGYYVFVNLEPGIYTVQIQAPYYLETAQEVEVSDLSSSFPVVTLRLKHKLGSPRLYHATCIQGQVETEIGRHLSSQRVYIYLKPSLHQIRLMEKIKKGSRKMRLLIRPTDEMDGQMIGFDIENSKELHHTIDFYDRESSTFRLKEPTQQEYEAKTSIYPMWELKTDEYGRFILPVKERYMDEKKMTIGIQSRWGNGEKTAELTRGRVNPMTFILNEQEEE